MSILNLFISNELKKLVAEPFNLQISFSLELFAEGKRILNCFIELFSVANFNFSDCCTADSMLHVGIGVILWSYRVCAQHELSFEDIHIVHPTLESCLRLIFKEKHNGTNTALAGFKNMKVP